jgi:flagellar basal-body rod protein FlgF
MAVMTIQIMWLVYQGYFKGWCVVLLRGLYTAATGMIHQTRRLDVVANNISNMNTSGFKRDQVVNRAFEDELLLRMEKGQTGTPIGVINHGVYVDKIMTSFEQGNMEHTGENTQMALKGSGFFTVLTDNGERYTRDGNFMIDNQGRLVTTEGWPVAGQAGPILVGTQDFVVDAGGNVIVGETYIDRLQIVNFEDLQALRKEGHNLYTNPDPNNPPIYFEGEVLQGFVEGSNVQVVQEVVDMMTATRNYESNQRILKMMDDSLGKAVNELGRV